MILLFLCYSQNKEKTCEATDPTLGTSLYPSAPLHIPQHTSISLSTPRYLSAPLNTTQHSSISLRTPLYLSSPFGILSAPLSTPQHPWVPLSTPLYPSAPLSTPCWQSWKMFIGCGLCFIAMNLHLNCFRNINSYQLYILLDWGVLKHGYPKNEVMMNHKRALVAINKHCRVY